MSEFSFGFPNEQSFMAVQGDVYRKVRIGNKTIESFIKLPEDASGLGEAHLLSTWWELYLSGAIPTKSVEHERKPISAVDLFCGAGGLAQGVKALAAELGREVEYKLIVDSDAGALATYVANHNVKRSLTKSVLSLVDFRVRGRGENARFAYPPELMDSEIATAVEGIDLLTAGPPCQGHSSLNNSSRGRDPRNYLLLSVIAFAVAADVSNVIIENVPRVVNDAASVLTMAKSLLLDNGYEISEGVLAANEMGWPQTRRRFFLVASKSKKPIPIDDVAFALQDSGIENGTTTLSWLLDLAARMSEHGSTNDPLNKPTSLSAENQRRISWLFEESEYDLPNELRPVCHQDGTTYSAVYGRMHPERAAPTITTGFSSPGRGRFVHPSEPRTLTAREASMIQGFPANYQFVSVDSKTPAKTELSKWIGDAVPMPLGYAAALSVLD